MNNNWHIFKKQAGPKQEIQGRLERILKDPPPWRDFKGDDPEAELDARRYRGEKYQAGDQEVEMVNTALYLRRPLLVTGKPGTGKSSLAYAVADQLDLGRVLYWPVTTRSTLKEALYAYDAIGRLQETEFTKQGEPNGDPQGGKAAQQKAVSDKASDIGRYITLGPLGTALLPSKKPRVLLIDEIDKSDIDLPNDLLNVFEEGGFDIPELKRMADFQQDLEVFTCDDQKAKIHKGRVLCTAFPFIVLTSNQERELPAPFLRRCLRLDIPNPDEIKLEQIVAAHFDEKTLGQVKSLIADFIKRRDEDDKLLSTDQLLNAVYLAARGIDMTEKDLLNAVMRDLSETERY